jgi:hypothetical protein
MNQNRAEERPLHDVIDVARTFAELERLARVDALLRVVAAYDRGDTRALNGRPAAARTRVDPGNVRRDAKC